MSNITDWIKNELYPSLFEVIDEALPEHEFKRYSGGWRSKTYLDGSPHIDRVDKTIVPKKAPGMIIEQGGDVLSLEDYIMKRDGVEFIQAVKTLANVAGIQLPKGDFNNQYNKGEDELLEDCNNYFKISLEKAFMGNDKAGYGHYITDYIDRRGYTGGWLNAEARYSKNSKNKISEGIPELLHVFSEDDLHYRVMELGYIPSQNGLFLYLLNKGYSYEIIRENLRLDTRIGGSHRLSIPYRVGGSIKGFKFRAITTEINPKYLNTGGLDEIEGIFNLTALKGDNDLIIVEGELDALHATARGVDNVVALGGTSISSEQVKYAIMRGAKKFTICLDRRPDKEAETTTKVENIINKILAEGVNKIYIVTLPDLGETQIIGSSEYNEGDFFEALENGVENPQPKLNPREIVFTTTTDPDRLIREKGIEVFIEAISEAMPYYEYKLIAILNKYKAIEIENYDRKNKIDFFWEKKSNKRGLTLKQIDSFLMDIIVVANAIQEPVDKVRFIKLVTSSEQIKKLGITDDILKITLDAN